MANNQNKTVSKNLKIIQINVNSLISISRRYDLQQFLNMHNPDIVLLNETKLNPRHRLQFLNYNIIRKDRVHSKQGGGTAILVRDKLKYYSFSNNIIDSFEFLEACIIKIPMISNKNMYIISAYYPSGNNDSKFKTDMFKLFDSLNLQNIDNYYILAGDLNGRHPDWGNPSDNPKGNYLKQWLMENEIYFRCKFYASNSPSFPRSGSYLDVCIADCRVHIEKTNNTINCLETLDYDSDHSAIQIFASMGNEQRQFTFLEEIQVSIYNYKKTNWKKFKNKIILKMEQELQIPDNRNLSNSEIDYHVNRLNNIIVSTVANVTPKNKKKDLYSNITNATIKNLHSEKSKILTLIKRHNRLEHTLTETSLNILKVKLKLIRKLINENFSVILNKKVQERLTRIDPKDSTHMFGEIKKNFKRFKPLNLQNIKICDSSEYLLNNAGIDPRSLEKDNLNNFIVKDQVQMLDTVGSYLESIHSEKQLDNNNNLHIKINDSFNTFLETKVLFEINGSTITNFSTEKKSNNLNVAQTENYFVTREEIKYIFSKLTNKLSSGIDNIPNIVLKNLPDIILFEYCNIFNNMLNNSYFPKDWKMAKVVILPKKEKDVSNPKNLRPISLLPNISKVFEICINNNINRVCTDKDLVSEKQFGFKYKHSTVNAIQLLTSNINWNWNKKLCTGACLIDMEKAFDSVWIAGLIVKLVEYKFPIHLIILIYNMINGKTFAIFYQNHRSTKTYKIINGLQQGTVNSPILFNLFLLDLIKGLENIISFADDIIVYHADNTIEKINENLQKAYDVVEKFTIDWNMRINTHKCETILFRPPVGKCNSNIRKNWKSFGIKSNIDNTVIPNKQVVKYLGIYLDKFLYFNIHVNEMLLKARNAFFVYKSLFYSKHLKSRVKVIMYQSLIRPIITYGCPIWFNISPSYMEKIRVFERKCLRACTSLFRSQQSNYLKYVSNKKLYNSANIIRIDNFIINLIRNYTLRCTLCKENNLILAPFYTNDEYMSNAIQNGFVPPEAFLCLDRMKIIQNEYAIPVFYHEYRRANIKAVNCNTTNNNLRYDTSINNREPNIIQGSSTKKFWWLE